MEPTCDQPGKTIGSHCAVCRAVLTAQQEVPATGHRMIKHPAIASTCSVAGKTEWEECEICGYCPAPPQAVAKLPHRKCLSPVGNRPAKTSAGPAVRSARFAGLKSCLRLSCTSWITLWWRFRN